MTRRIKTISFIAIFITLVMLSSFMLARLGVSIKVFAETSQASQNLVLGDDVFLDMRSSLKQKYFADKSFGIKEFSDWDFQQAKDSDGNDENFNVIKSEEISKIVDARFGVSLKDESRAIRLNRNKATNTDPLGGIVGPRISENSSLTFMTYGQGGSLAHWSNNGRYVKSTDNDDTKIDLYETFSYQKDSMIEFLRRSSNADVYIAKTNQINVAVDNNPDKKKFYPKFEVQVGGKSFNENVLLLKLDATTQSYENANKFESLIEAGKSSSILKREFKEDEPTLSEKAKIDRLDKIADAERVEPLILTDIEDKTKHNIIVFDTDNSNQYHNYVYNQINIILTQISYEYLVTIGQVPKISMISHSTGGKWNMMWANKHPLNVDKLLAIAATFNGTALGHLLYFDWDRIAGAAFDLGELLLTSLGESMRNPSGFNNVDHALYKQLNEDWEKAIIINPNLYCFAVAGPTSIGLVLENLIPGIDEITYGLQEYIAIVIVLKVIELVLRIMAITAIASAVTLLTTAVPVAGIVAAFVGITAVAAALGTLANLIYAFGPIISYFYESIYVDKNGELTLYDDFIVDVDSALGRKASYDFKETYTYSNFIRHEKTFRPDNCDIRKRNVSSFAVGHNLEIQDNDVISDVYGNITMDKPETRYNYTVLADRTIRIDGIKDGFYNKKIVVPDYIDGMPVSQIAEGALQNEREVTSVELGENVTNIESSAFEGAMALNEVILNDNLLKIGRGAFQSTAITSIEIPSATKEIWSNAFANTALVDAKIKADPTNPNKGSALRIVGEGAFNGTPFINNGTSNIVLGGVLVKYRSTDKEYILDSNSDVKYFAQKCFEGSQLEKLDVSKFAFTDNIIPDYFLYGAEKLKQISLPSTINQIGNSSFESTKSLSEFTICGKIGAIGARAFAYSGIKNLWVESSYPPVISRSDTFEGISSDATIWIKKYAEGDFKQLWGSKLKYETEKSVINFYDNSSLAFSEEAYYYGYMDSHYWMLNGNYTKEGYYFLGWYDNNGKSYYSGSLLEFDLGEEWKLTAYWELEDYNLWYEEYGGASDNKSSITVVDVFALKNSVKRGYIFEGWYDNASFSGAPISALAKISKDTKLYAKFSAIKTNINFDATGISLNKTNQEVVFDERFYAPIPEKASHAFAGWYTTLNDNVTKGVRITGINGVSLKTSGFISEITLYARWTSKSFVLEFTDGNSSLVLGNSGLTTDAGSVLAGQKVDVNSAEFQNMFKRNGYIFEYFTDENGNRLDFSNGVPDLGKNFSTFTISPVIKAEQYTFSFYDYDSNTYKNYTVSYDAEYNFSTSRYGYIFEGWADRNGNIVFYESNGVITTDFTPGAEGNGNVELFSVWTPVVGNIVFDSAGGTKVVTGNDYQAVFNEVLPSITVPTRQGYAFEGFYDYNNIQYINITGNGIKAWNKTDSAVTLYAKWTARKYTLNYNYRNHEEKTDVKSFYSDNVVTFTTTGFEKVGYTFAGWYDSATGGTLLRSTSGIYKDLTLYARWTENKFAIASDYFVTVASNNVAIDLGTTASTTVGYHIFELSSNVDKIFIYGRAAKNIAIQSNAHSLTIYFKDTYFTSPTDFTAIHVLYELKIVVLSTSEVRGANGEAGSSGTQGAHNNSHGSPSNSVTWAGSGSSGNGGADGGSGQIALKANSVTISGNGNFKAYGGAGGIGGGGGTGGNGAYGSDGEQGGNKDDAVSGGHGGTGGKGGIGGNGGLAVYANSFSNNNTNAQFYGGSAGNGGRGGVGGAGGKGGKGANFLLMTNSPGNGGDGGNGGKGGSGGQCGAKSIAVFGNPNIGTSGTIGVGGAGGKGGSAGGGGMHGDGGGSNGGAGINGSGGSKG